MVVPARDWQDAFAAPFTSTALLRDKGYTALTGHLTPVVDAHRPQEPLAWPPASMAALIRPHRAARHAGAAITRHRAVQEIRQRLL